MTVKKDEIKIQIEDITIEKDNIFTLEDKEQHLNGKTVIYKIHLDLHKTDEVIFKVIKVEKYKEEEIGGIVSFVHDIQTYFFIFNANGIYRLTIELDNDDFEQFNYPKRFIKELEILYRLKSCIFRINNCIFGNYFHIEQYREGIQVMQLYDLRTMQIQQIFNIYEEKKYNKYSDSILAISANKQMIAFSSGYGKLALYLIENGLEIIHKYFRKDTKIIACKFKDANNLMIIVKKAKYKDAEMLLWNLYTNKFQKYDKYIGAEDEKSIFYSASISCKYVLVDDCGGVFSVYDNSCKVESSDKILEYVNNKGKVQPFLHNREPWITDITDITDNKNKIWVYLDQNKSIQLYIEKYTVQVWHQIEQKEKFILEYIWVNDEILQIFDLIVYENKIGFSLKLENNIHLEWVYNDDNGHKNLMRHACYALEYLNDQRDKLVGYENQHVFEEIKYNVTLMIWRFIRNYPGIWKLLDIHYNLMASIIIGGSNTLIKYILFGDDNVVNHEYLHIPRLTRWIGVELNDRPKKKLEIYKDKSDLQIAIGLCKPGLERNRRILVVTYLLEYYSQNATKHDGWLITISKALPDLYKYNLGIEISNIIEHTDIIPKNIQIILKAKQKYTAFNPISKLISTSEPKFNFKALGKVLRLKLTKLYAKFLPNNYENCSPTVKMVPLHNLTINSIHEKNNDKPSQLPLYLQRIIKFLKFLFIPRGYVVINSADAEKFAKLSPFVQIIRKENNDDIFNNPVMEAVIDYKWKPARNYFLRLFVLYILFAACFAAICGTYVAHSEATGYRCYLLVVEYRQFEHHGWRYYFKLFNCVDLASVVVAVVVMSVHVTPSFDTKNAFANVETTQEITIAISFTMLLLWFEFILYLRLISEPAKYIYIMLNIINETWIFLAFMILVMAGLADSFLLLLQYPDFTNLTESTTSSTLITDDSNFKIQNDFDRTEDNPAKNFVISFLATYNWLNGAFLQQDAWSFWAVKFITFFGSFLLVTILQNMFIAFMGGVYSNAYEKGRVALLRFRKSISHDNWEENVKNWENKNLYDDYETKMIERKLSYEDEEDDHSDDEDSSENEKKNENTGVKELNNKVVKKGKEKEISITELDNKVSKEEDISNNDLNNKINEYNIKYNSRFDEINSKIDKLLNLNHSVN
ncbi:3606_t:CDS:10 [Funneliformis mosseae]|uniref:3606_t:CDS:1 n=1 Tax=Funneliformis mosseae TaxID=27381 RepID=A0A9N9CPR5_FUNMO|nr:3606_t:CDS:10 [Funneliformis mosseae]